MNDISKLSPVYFNQNVRFGADPEVFFTKSDGTVLGSEKFIPQRGWSVGSGSSLVRDGVQAELHPAPNNCRGNFSNEISRAFRNIRDQLMAMGNPVKISFDRVVEVSQEEMDSLSEESKIFGCGASLNVYSNAESIIPVDPKKYLKRSGGGHIHLGYVSQHMTQEYNSLTGKYNEKQEDPTYIALMRTPEITVSILDIIVGNTCVLLDRDENNIERRKVYGRAGEYRMKSYGLEYRTLSNFWLEHYQMTSFVLGLARFAINVISQSDPKKPEFDYVNAFLSAVPKEDIIEAINTNNFELAYTNFLKIEPIIRKISRNQDYHPFVDVNLLNFHWFIDRGVDNKFKYWFKGDPMNNWCETHDRHGHGWESFLYRIVKDDMSKSENVKLLEMVQVKLNVIREKKLSAKAILTKAVETIQSGSTDEPIVIKTESVEEVKKIKRILKTSNLTKKKAPIKKKVLVTNYNDDYNYVVF